MVYYVLCSNGFGSAAMMVGSVNKKTKMAADGRVI